MLDITIEGPKAPMRSFFMKQVMAKTTQDNKIMKGTTSRPNHAPSAQSNLMSPPPNASGCFLIKNNEANTGKKYPNIAPSELHITACSKLSAKSSPAKEAYVKPATRRGIVNKSGNKSILLSISYNKNKLNIKKTKNPASIGVVQIEIKKQVAEDTIAQPSERIIYFL